MSVRVRDAYRQIELYEPGRLPVEIDLSDNTNLFGVAPAVRKLTSAIPDPLLTRYPSVFARALKEALAQRHGVAPENIATGCGSDDLIDSTIRAFSEPGDAFAFPVPTFGVVGTFARMNATTPVGVLSAEDFSIDVAGLVAAKASVTYICSPNNPTGSVVTKDQIETLDRHSSGVVILDEAYADFGDADHARFATGSARTVSLRTMSKACGLAGLRVGYAIGPANVILEIEKSRGPYKVGGFAEAAAVGVISEDGEWIADVIEQTTTNRARLAEALDDLRLRYWPSSGNFILIQLPDGLSAVGTNAALRERGVAARAFPALPHAGECLRVTVGPWPMLERFLKALNTVMAQ